MKIFDDQLIVITGGAGFIGSGVIRYLNDRGLSNIVVVDDLGTGEKWKNLVNKRFVGIISKHEIFKWLEGKQSLIEAFIHLGACSDTMEMNADYLLENNYRYSVKLAEYALKNNHRFIYASSAATYGDGSHGFKDKEKDIYRLQPLNMYGFSKQLFDQWVFSEGVLNKVVGLKYFNVFGPNEAHKGHMASAITKMVPRVVQGEAVQLFKTTKPESFGDGEQKRDFVYVKDAVRMTCAFLENEANGIFNIGSGKAVTWNELATAVHRAVGKATEIEYIDMPKTLVAKYQSYSQADMTKTKKVLEELAKCTSLDDSVSDYVCNYLVPEKKW
jgi:ADP-L-glycero-D-manno-heptose 6-epimerase